MTISRRQVLFYLCALLPLGFMPLGCEKARYRRPWGELDLGPIKTLLYERVFIREKSILLYRDSQGWYALSTRCTFRGCDLSYRDNYFVCPCCKSTYALDGSIIEGPTPERLPWLSLRYADGHLYANPGKVVNSSYRYTLPAIEEAIKRFRKEIKSEGISDEVKIPKILLGSGDGEGGRMFLDEDPVRARDYEMIE